MGAVTVVTSGKGGVGKSTLCAGLGYAMARRGKRVLLVDGDAGLSCLDHMLGISENRVFDISDVVAGRAEPSQAIYSCPGSSRLFLLPAPGSVEDVVSPSVMVQLVSVLSRYYDHVLVDCPAGLGGGFLSAVASAQRALVVSTPDPVCIRNAGKARLALERTGVPQQRLVINRFSGARFRTAGAYQDLDAVIDACGLRLIGVVPEDSAIAAAASNARDYGQKTPGAMALARLAARLEGEQVPLPSLNKF